MIHVVAIDGPVGVGKSTVARQVAENLGFRHIDTGAMYRSVAWRVMQDHPVGTPSPETVERAARAIRIELPEDGRIIADGVDVSEIIRDESVSAFVPLVADNMAVREALVREQRRLGQERPSVLEGRDIGTVVFPDAACKFFLDAAPRVRAERRVAQLAALGRHADFDTVYRNLLERDDRDRRREWGALRVADNAIIMDTTSFAEPLVVSMICSVVRAHESFRESLSLAQ